MPYTNVNLIQPIKPWVSSGGKVGANIVPIPVKASQAYNPGDLISLVDGVATVAASPPAGTTAASSVLGVCLDKFPSTTPVDNSMTIMVALADDGIFEGTIVNATDTTDYTYTAANFDAESFFQFNVADIDTSSGTRNVVVLNSKVIGSGAPTTQVCVAKVICISPNQTGGRSSTTASLIHPRVLFVFLNAGTKAYLT